MEGFFIKEIHAKAKWDSMRGLVIFFSPPPKNKKNQQKIEVIVLCEWEAGMGQMHPSEIQNSARSPQRGSGLSCSTREQIWATALQKSPKESSR